VEFPDCPFFTNPTFLMGITRYLSLVTEYKGGKTFIFDQKNLYFVIESHHFLYMLPIGDCCFFFLSGHFCNGA
jgi:hypothetical protein